MSRTMKRSYNDADIYNASINRKRESILYRRTRKHRLTNKTAFVSYDTLNEYAIDFGDNRYEY